MSMTSAELRSLLTLVYKLVFLSLWVSIWSSPVYSVWMYSTLCLRLWVGFWGLRFGLTVGPMVSDRKM